MIKLLKTRLDNICGCQDGIRLYPQDDYLIYSLLDEVEKSGMVPPMLDDKSFTMLESGELTFAVHEWEEE